MLLCFTMIGNNSVWKPLENISFFKIASEASSVYFQFNIVLAGKFKFLITVTFGAKIQTLKKNHMRHFWRFSDTMSAQFSRLLILNVYCLVCFQASAFQTFLCFDANFKPLRIESAYSSLFEHGSKQCHHIWTNRPISLRCRPSSSK